MDNERLNEAIKQQMELCEKLVQKTMNKAHKEPPIKNKKLSKIAKKIKAIEGIEKLSKNKKIETICKQILEIAEVFDYKFSCRKYNTIKTIHPCRIFIDDCEVGIEIDGFLRHCALNAGVDEYDALYYEFTDKMQFCLVEMIIR